MKYQPQFDFTINPVAITLNITDDDDMPITKVPMTGTYNTPEELDAACQQAIDDYVKQQQIDLQIEAEKEIKLKQNEASFALFTNHFSVSKSFVSPIKIDPVVEPVVDPVVDPLPVSDPVVKLPVDPVQSV